MEHNRTGTTPAGAFVFQQALAIQSMISILSLSLHLSPKRRTRGENSARLTLSAIVPVRTNLAVDVTSLRQLYLGS